MTGQKGYISLQSIRDDKSIETETQDSQGPNKTPSIQNMNFLCQVNVTEPADRKPVASNSHSSLLP